MEVEPFYLLIDITMNYSNDSQRGGNQGDQNKNKGNDKNQNSGMNKDNDNDSRDM